MEGGRGVRLGVVRWKMMSGGICEFGATMLDAFVGVV